MEPLHCCVTHPNFFVSCQYFCAFKHQQRFEKRFYQFDQHTRCGTSPSIICLQHFNNILLIFMLIFCQGWTGLSCIITLWISQSSSYLCRYSHCATRKVCNIRLISSTIYASREVEAKHDYWNLFAIICRCKKCSTCDACVDLFVEVTVRVTTFSCKTHSVCWVCLCHYRFSLKRSSCHSWLLWSHVLYHLS